MKQGPKFLSIDSCLYFRLGRWMLCHQGLQNQPVKLSQYPFRHLQWVLYWSPGNFRKNTLSCMR